MVRSSPHVAIIGGGISGLATAFALQKASQQQNKPITCTLIESQPRFGGKIVTNHLDGFLIEGGPDSFLTSKPWALELCEDLGLSGQLINTNAGNSQTFCYAKGRLRELPQGLVAFVPTRLRALCSGGLISPIGMLRMGWEWFVPRRTDPDDDESLASFFRRRLGAEAFDYFIEPLVAGIYAGNADELSLRATFPRFLELEQQYGSLIKGMRVQQARGRPPSPGTQPRRTMFTTLRGGLGDLIESLVKRLTDGGTRLLSGRQVVDMRQGGSSSHSGYTLRLDNADNITVDDVVLATPAYVSAKLLEPIQPTVAGLLQQIPYCSTATISLAFRESDVEGKIKGFGFVIPRVERHAMIAATWTSLKWSDRTRTGQALVRCYVGGKGREHILQEDDTALIRYIREQLQAIVGLSAEPLLTEVHRWDRAMPQYVCGHLARLQDIRVLMKDLPGLHLTGAAFDGLGIPDCIREGTRLGTALVESYE
ncbi:MAG: protoporphyrinogen oxidase [Nitrospirales bacterium]|nr:protoporphyrinogen oxidase [Nitrospira sp.]MDR4502499.1 protoporphyrinogen oxidase [Nitrospirales bacterium]